MHDDDLADFLRSLVLQAPMLAVYLAAIVVLVLRWRRHPRVSVLGLLAVTLGILLTVARAADFILFEALRDENADAITDVVMFLENAVEAIAFVLLLLAIVMDRPRAPRTIMDEDHFDWSAK
jgi:hypothetical protein